MTCRVNVIAPDGSVMPARAVLDSLGSKSLNTEHLAQQLHLPRHATNSTVSMELLGSLSAPGEM